MSLPELVTPTGTPGTPFGAALLYFLGTVTVGVLGYFGVRFTAAAPLQKALNVAFTTLTAEFQSERARFIAQISELEAERESLTSEVLRLRGQVRSLQQTRDSLIALMEHSGIDIPGKPRPK